MATFFGVMALIVLDRKIKEGWKAGTVIGPICLLLALLSAEYGIVAAAYVLAYLVFLDQRNLKRRVFEIMPYLTVLAIWMTVYKISGFGSYGSGLYTDPFREPLLFLSSVVERLPILFAGQWTTLPGGVLFVVSQSAIDTIWTVSVLILVIVAFTLFPLIRKDKIARFWGMGFVLALIPMCASIPDDRLLIFVGLGGFGLLAQFLNAVHAEADQARALVDWLPTRSVWKASANLLYVLFILIHGVISPLTMPFTPLRMAQFSERLLGRPAVDLPADSNFAKQTVVLVNPPNGLMASYIRWRRLAEGLPLAARTWILSSASSETGVHRLDDRTLEIELTNGFIGAKLDEIYRSSSFPMKVGQQVELSGMTVAVLSLTEDGRPKKASFRFSVPLENPSLNILQWRFDEYIPFTPPEIGSTRYLPRARFF